MPGTWCQLPHVLLDSHLPAFCWHQCRALFILPVTASHIQWWFLRCLAVNVTSPVTTHTHTHVHSHTHTLVHTHAHSHTCTHRLTHALLYFHVIIPYWPNHNDLESFFKNLLLNYEIFLPARKVEDNIGIYIIKTYIATIQLKNYIFQIAPHWETLPLTWYLYS